MIRRVKDKQYPQTNITWPNPTVSTIRVDFLSHISNSHILEPPKNNKDKMGLCDLLDINKVLPHHQDPHQNHHYRS